MGSDTARFEVGLWAGMTRQGVVVEHEPPQPGSDSFGDFLVTESGVRIAIEAKELESSRSDENHAQIAEALQWAQLNANREPSLPHHDLTFVADPQLADDAWSLEPSRFQSAWAQRVYNTVFEFYKTTCAGAIHSRTELDGIGGLIIKPDDGGWGIEVKGIREGGVEHTVTRALRSAKKANEQLANYEAALKVVVIWIPTWETPLDEAKRLIPSRLRPDSDFHLLDYIVLLQSHRLAGPWTTAVAPHRLPWARGDIEGMRWLKGLTAWQLGLGFTIPDRRVISPRDGDALVARPPKVPRSFPDGRPPRPSRR